MPFLQIEDTEIPVAVSGATKKGPERIGSSQRMFAGNLRTAVRKEKRSWSVTTRLMAESAAREIENLVAEGVFLPCSGDMLDSTRSEEDLFMYTSGDDVEALGGVHTRADAAYYTDKNGILQLAAENVLRDSHYIDGVRHTLLEPARTNLCLRSQDFEQWPTQSGGSATANTTIAPDGTLTADTVTGGGVAESGIYQVPAWSDGTGVSSIYLKAGTATRTDLLIYDTVSAPGRRRVIVTWTAGVPVVTSALGSGAIYAVESLANGWYRISFTNTVITAANNTRFYLYPHNAAPYTGTVYAWGAQCEAAITPSSYTPTLDAAVERAIDALYFDYTAVPQAMSVYLHGFNLGAYNVAPVTGQSRVLHIGDPTSFGDPRFSIGQIGANKHYAQHDNGILNETSAEVFSPSPLFGERIEHLVTVTGAGTMTSTFVLEDGTVQTAPSSIAVVLLSAWYEPTLRFSGHAESGLFAFQQVVIAAGVKTLDEMRGGAAVECEVTIGESVFVQTASGVLRALQLMLREV